MATYLVADPSGQKHKIQGPDGASPQEIIAQAQKIIPYKPTAGVGGMMQPPPQGGMPQNAMPGQPPLQGGQQQPPQGGQQNPFQGMNLGSSGVNILGQLLLNRAGLSMPTPPAQMNPLQQSEMTKNYAEAGKASNPPMEWSDTGRTTKKGFPILVNKTSGEEKIGTIAGAKGPSDADDFKHTVLQDRLEKEYQDRIMKVVGSRTGGLGLQDQKVDQAIHLRSMVNQSWNPQTKTYEIPEMQQGELIIGLANLMSGSSVGSMEQLRSITPRTAQGDTAHLVSYWTGKPVTNQPQEMIKNLVSSIDRQGKVAEQLRDKYMSGIKMLRPKDLDKDRADAIAAASLTSSFSDTLKDSPDQDGGSSQAYSDPGKEARYQAWKKSQGL